MTNNNKKASIVSDAPKVRTQNKSDKLYFFIFCEDVRQWYGKQTNVKRYKRKRKLNKYDN